MTTLVILVDLFNDREEVLACPKKALAVFDMHTKLLGSRSLSNFNTSNVLVCIPTKDFRNLSMLAFLLCYLLFFLHGRTTRVEYRCRVLFLYINKTSSPSMPFVCLCSILIILKCSKIKFVFIYREKRVRTKWTNRLCLISSSRTSHFDGLLTIV